MDSSSGSFQTTTSNPHSHLMDNNFESSSSSFQTTTTTAVVVVKNPRKKRSPKTTPSLKLNNIHDGGVSKPKPTRKPDPFAPKITRPCTECGRKFWSWKALFGHMRCHPEREWRGINPPPNIRRRTEAATSSDVTDEDHEVANCLLLLANGPTPTPPSDHGQSPSITTVNQLEYYYSCPEQLNNNNMDLIMGCRGFECSSCKKVFGSHQALGGHRASHKNVKGCYAINKNDHGEDDQKDQVVDEMGFCIGGGGGGGGCSNDNNNNNTTTENCTTSSSLGGLAGHHECSICLRVFSSGQALGGHKRCHWEKMTEAEEDEPPRICGGVGGFDLNFPAAPILKDDIMINAGANNYYSAGLGLDLRLGI